MKTIIAVAPTNRNALRSAIEAEEPKVALSCVVSAERREAISPVFSASKKPGRAASDGQKVEAQVRDDALAQRHDEIISPAGNQRQHGDDPDQPQKVVANEGGVESEKPWSIIRRTAIGTTRVAAEATISAASAATIRER